MDNEETSTKIVNKPSALKDKQHDDDEPWISEEELYTEESTDDDEGKSEQPRKTKKRENRRTKPSKILTRPSLCEETNATVGGKLAASAAASSNLTQHGHSSAPKTSTGLITSVTRLAAAGAENDARHWHEADDDDYEQILWRPKRGSIKLPDLERYQAKQDSFSEAHSIVYEGGDALESTLENFTSGATIASKQP